jgi:hypothetical protein
MNTYAALIKVMKMYRDEPTLLQPKEFVILSNYHHYLHEQCGEVDTWNRLKWYEYYENPFAMGLQETGIISRNYALTF